MKIFAHRGLVYQYPENTLISFEHALKQGFGIELDIHRTKDQQIVVIHDNNLQRVNNTTTKIKDCTLEYLKTLNLNNGFWNNFNIKSTPERIPTLTEVLDLFYKYSSPNTEIAIQIKDCSEENIEKLTLKTIEKFHQKQPSFNIFQRVFLFDITAKSAKIIKQNNSQIRIAYSIGESNFFPDKKYPSIYTLDQINNLTPPEIIWADEWQNGLYNKECVEDCKKRKIKVYAISPELHANTTPSHPKAKTKEEVWKILLDINVDGICTDYPQEFKEYYQDYNKNKKE